MKLQKDDRPAAEELAQNQPAGDRQPPQASDQPQSPENEEQTEQEQGGEDDPEEEYDEDEDEEDDEGGRRRSGCSLVGLILVLVFAAVLLGGAWMVMQAMDEIAGSGSLGETVTVSVEKGTSPSEIADLLEENGVIEHSLFFKAYLKLTDSSGQLQYGDFNLQPGMGYDDIIERLSQTKPKETVWVTIPEGSTVIQFANRMEEAGLCTADEFIDAANNGDYSDIGFWSRIDTDPDTFMKAEGYLFPDTYEFYADETPENIVRKLYEQFDKEITDEMYARMDEMGMSLREIITLASLVQEEAGDPANQPGVAGVFYNRLQPDSPYPRMGSDVTWYYLSDFVFPYYAKLNGVDADQGESVTPENIKNAYYTGDNDPNSRVGLPAGPLSSPGRDAIKAALYPEEHDYYFFLTDKAGKYYYARTFEEHQQNIQAAEAVNASLEG